MKFVVPKEGIWGIPFKVRAYCTIEIAVVLEAGNIGGRCTVEIGGWVVIDVRDLDEGTD